MQPTVEARAKLRADNRWSANAVLSPRAAASTLTEVFVQTTPPGLEGMSYSHLHWSREALEATENRLVQVILHIKKGAAILTFILTL